MSHRRRYWGKTNPQKTLFTFRQVWSVKLRLRNKKKKTPAEHLTMFIAFLIVCFVGWDRCRLLKTFKMFSMNKPRTCLSSVRPDPGWFFPLVLLLLGKPGSSLILLLWFFVLSGFNLCLPLFFHQSVEPHGGLCILDLGARGRHELCLVAMTSFDNKKWEMRWWLTDECSPCWTFTLSISLQRSFSEGRPLWRKEAREPDHTLYKSLWYCVGTAGGQNPCVIIEWIEAQHSTGTSRKTQLGEGGVFKIPLQSSWRVCTSECPGFSFLDDPRVKSETGFWDGYKSANLYSENILTSFYYIQATFKSLWMACPTTILPFRISATSLCTVFTSSPAVSHTWMRNDGVVVHTWTVNQFFFYDFFHDSPFLMSCGRTPLTAVR